MSNTKLFFLIFILIFSSCVQNKNEKKDVLEKKQKDTISTKKEILLEKDTLFSIFTSDMSIEDCNKTMNKLAKEGGNFIHQNQEGYTLDGEVFCCVDVICYEMLFNNISYILNIEFNKTMIFDEEKALSNKLDILILTNESYENNKILPQLLNMYSEKYGSYKKDTKTQENEAFHFNLKEKPIIESIEKIDTYKFKSKPNLKIEFIKRHYVKKIDNEIVKDKYIIRISYYSNRFLNKLNSLNDEKSKIKQEEKIEQEKSKNRKRSLQNTDI